MKAPLTLDIVYPHLPPAVNGIGDHSAILARSIADQGHGVRLLGRLGPGQAEAIRETHGVEAVDAWPSGRLADTGALLASLSEGGADAVVLQFEQFSYGPRGWNPRIARLFAAMRARIPSTRRVLFAHENYVYPGSPGHTLMWAYQRRQFLRLAGDADRVVVTTDAWTKRDRLPGALVLPVFSNLPDPVGTALAADAHAPVVWFGYLDGARLPYFEAVVEELDRRRRRLVYVGVDGGLARSTAARLRYADLTVVDAPPAAEVSRVLQGASFVVAPFPDGVSSRRGTLMAALQHGRWVVTNTGPGSDDLVHELVRDEVVAAAADVSPEAYAGALRDALDRSPAEIAARSRRAADIYVERFAPPVAASTLLAALRR